MTNNSYPPSRLAAREASEYLLRHHGISRTTGTLAKLRVLGGGPAFRKAGLRRVLYDVADLNAWADSIISSPVRTTTELNTTN